MLQMLVILLYRTRLLLNKLKIYSMHE